MYNNFEINDIDGILQQLRRARRHFKIYIGSVLYNLKATQSTYDNLSRDKPMAIMIEFDDYDGGEGHGELMISCESGINYTSFTYSPKRNTDTPSRRPDDKDIDPELFPYSKFSTDGIPLSFYEEISDGYNYIVKSWNGVATMFDGDEGVLRISIEDVWVSILGAGSSAACVYNETSHYREEWFDNHDYRYRHNMDDAEYYEDNIDIMSTNWKPPFFIANKPGYELYK